MMQQAAKLLLIHGAVLISCAEPAPVPSLTRATFDETITPDKLWLVKFYAPWCGHCKRLAPILEDIASRPEALGDAQIAKVDCTVEKALCTRFEVRGFPSVQLLKDGHVWEHKGPRSKAAIEALLVRMQRPPVRELSSVDELNDALAAAAANQTALFLLGDGAGTADLEARAPGVFDVLRDGFKQTARKLQHKDSFASTSSSAVVKAVLEAGGTAVPTPSGAFVVRAETGEAPSLFEPPSDAQGSLSDAMDEFVGLHRLPRFSVAGASNFYELSSSGKPLCLLVLDPKSVGVPKITRALSDTPGPAADLRALARDPALQKQYVFALLDYGENEEHVRENYFIERDTLPRLVVLQRFSGERAFAVDTPGDATSGAERMRAFTDGVAAGTIRYEYEGFWGIPDRNFRVAKRYLPFLSALDALPKYTLTVIIIVLVCYLVLKLILMGESNFAPVDPYTMYDEPPKRAAPREHKRTAKVD